MGHMQKHIASKPKRIYNCFLCNKIFSKKFKFEAHMQKMSCGNKHNQSLQNGIPCTYEGCEKVFYKRFNMLRHREKAHGISRSYLKYCKCCKLEFRERSKFRQHMKDGHSEKRATGRPRKDWNELSERSKNRRKNVAKS